MVSCTQCYVTEESLKSYVCVSSLVGEMGRRTGLVGKILVNTEKKIVVMIPTLSSLAATGHKSPV